MIVHSAIVRLPLTQVEAGPERSTRAGQVALRRALVKLAAQLEPAALVPEDGFRLEHGAGGEPTVRAVPPGFPGRLEALRVSVSHTRAHAWALAVIEEPEAARG